MMCQRLLWFDSLRRTFAIKKRPFWGALAAAILDSAASVFILSFLALAFNLYKPALVFLDFVMDVRIAAILRIYVEFVQDVLVIGGQVVLLVGHVVFHDHLEDGVLRVVLLRGAGLYDGRDGGRDGWESCRD
jgi:hypothetical protein